MSIKELFIVLLLLGRSSELFGFSSGLKIIITSGLLLVLLAALFSCIVFDQGLTLFILRLAIWQGGANLFLLSETCAELAAVEGENLVEVEDAEDDEEEADDLL